jgi:hypothetical protein
VIALVTLTQATYGRRNATRVAAGVNPAAMSHSLYDRCGSEYWDDSMAFS